MQVQMNHVKSHIARTGDSHDGIQVCPVIVVQSSCLMHDFCDFQYIAVKYTHCVWIGKHKSSRIISHNLPQLIKVHTALIIGRNADYGKSRHGTGSRVGSVSGIRYNDFGAFHIAPGFVVCLNQQQPGIIAVGACRGLECHLVHACNLTEQFLCLYQHFQASLDCFFRLQGMDACKARKGCHLFIQLWIIFHGTGAQRIKSVIYTMCTFHQFCIMSGDINFSHLRKSGSLFSGLPGRNLCNRYIAGRKQ